MRLIERDRHSDWLGIILLSIGLMFLLLASCATVQVTDAEKQTEKILTSDILKDNHIVTQDEKKEIKTVLIQNDNVMKEEQNKISELTKETESEKKWSKIGKQAIAFCGVIIFLIIARIFVLIFKMIKTV